jgi:hypothetical protein
MQKFAQDMVGASELKARHRGYRGLFSAFLPTAVAFSTCCQYPGQSANFTEQISKNVERVPVQANVGQT